MKGWSCASDWKLRPEGAGSTAFFMIPHQCNVYNTLFSPPSFGFLCQLGAAAISFCKVLNRVKFPPSFWSTFGLHINFEKDAREELNTVAHKRTSSVQCRNLWDRYAEDPEGRTSVHWLSVGQQDRVCICGINQDKQWWDLLGQMCLCWHRVCHWPELWCRMLWSTTFGDGSSSVVWGVPAHHRAHGTQF